MTKSTSVFLDGLRSLAALTVFAAHCSYILYAAPVWRTGHAAVILFFVLSGYVIAYSTVETKQLSVKKYIIARLSRLYSVVIPALLLTAFLLICGWAMHLGFYGLLSRDYDVRRFILTGLFLQSVWGYNLYPGSDGPIWSLGYEFWYYVIFGVLIFVKKWKWKAAFVLGCCLVVGKNILLLFPIWLLGAGLYIYRDRWKAPHRTALCGYVVMLLMAITCLAILPEYPGKPPVPPLYYSASYLTDWILGLVFGGIIWFYAQAWRTLRLPETLAAFVRWVADRSFSLYLYHFPLLIFINALGCFNPHVAWQAAVEISLVLLLIALLSEATESKRGFWRKAFEQIWMSLESAKARRLSS